MAEKATSINLGRHKRNCSICAHEEVKEIEAAFIAWKSPAAIAGRIRLVGPRQCLPPCPRVRALREKTTECACGS